MRCLSSDIDRTVPSTDAPEVPTHIQTMPIRERSLREEIIRIHMKYIKKLLLISILYFIANKFGKFSFQSA